jgi:hypothetical protein
MIEISVLCFSVSYLLWVSMVFSRVLVWRVVCSMKYWYVMDLIYVLRSVTVHDLSYKEKWDSSWLLLRVISGRRRFCFQWKHRPKADLKLVIRIITCIKWIKLPRARFEPEICWYKTGLVNADMTSRLRVTTSVACLWRVYTTSYVTIFNLFQNYPV